MGFWVAEMTDALRADCARPVRKVPGERRILWPQTRASRRSRERAEVGATLVAGDGMDLVDDDGADTAEELAGLGGGEEDVEGFGGGDEDVRRVAGAWPRDPWSRVSPVRTAVRIWLERGSRESRG